MTDLFETPELIPENIQGILSSFDENADEYRELERLQSEVEQQGYTFDYYLNAEPFNLRKI